MEQFYVVEGFSFYYWKQLSNEHDIYGRPPLHLDFGDTFMTACILQKSQKASSSLSRLTKKVTFDMSKLSRQEEFLRICGDELLAEKDRQYTSKTKSGDTKQPRSSVFFVNRF